MDIVNSRFGRSLNNCLCWSTVIRCLESLAAHRQNLQTSENSQKFLFFLKFRCHALKVMLKPRVRIFSTEESSLFPAISWFGRSGNNSKRKTNRAKTNWKTWNSGSKGPLEKTFFLSLSLENTNPKYYNHPFEIVPCRSTIYSIRSKICRGRSNGI